MKFIEASCLKCDVKELLPKLPNIQWCEWPFIHRKCPEKLTTQDKNGKSDIV